MNREVLDRLLVDRALGALDPDVGELLSAYLETDEGAALRAREFSQATELARRALGSADNTTLPPFPAAALAAAERSRRVVRLVTRAASLAACLLLGIAVGAWALRPAAPTPQNGARTPLSGTAVARADTRPEPGFWSMQRYYDQLRGRDESPAPRAEWSSPVRLPKVGGMS